MAPKRVAEHKEAGQDTSEISYIGIRMRSWGSWVSEVRVPKLKKRIWLGSFGSPEKAARAHDAAMYCLRGRKAKFNFPSERRPPVIPGSVPDEDIKAIARHFSSLGESEPPAATQVQGGSQDLPRIPEMDESAAGSASTDEAEESSQDEGDSQDLPYIPVMDGAATSVASPGELLPQVSTQVEGMSQGLPYIPLADGTVTRFASFDGIFIPVGAQVQGNSRDLPYIPVMDDVTASFASLSEKLPLENDIDAFLASLKGSKAPASVQVQGNPQDVLYIPAMDNLERGFAALDGSSAPVSIPGQGDSQNLPYTPVAIQVQGNSQDLPFTPVMDEKATSFAPPVPIRSQGASQEFSDIPVMGTSSAIPVPPSSPWTIDNDLISRLFFDEEWLLSDMNLPEK